MNNHIDPEVLGRLRAAKETVKDNGEIREIIEARDEVLARYSPMFQTEKIGQISEEALRSFLYFENNKHWTGLNRQVNRICADMDAARTALAALVDEAQSLQTRMEPAVAIKGMGKGIITAILHVAYPDRYGVWNNTSDASLVELGLMPKFDRGARFGERYSAINQVLQSLAAALDVDLWTLDAMWWMLRPADDFAEIEAAQVSNGAAAPTSSASKKAFALERHLGLLPVSWTRG